MSTYTISPELLKNITTEEGIYLTDILFVFSQKNNHFKVAKDKHGLSIDSYLLVDQNKEVIKTWLELMSYTPSTFETIDVNLKGIDCEETKFLKLCKETNGQKKIILYSLQNIKKHSLDRDFLQFEGTTIQILDRDQARTELTNIVPSGDTYINSQVAKENSSINKSNN